jgi:hypothetical protein
MVIALDELSPSLVFNKNDPIDPVIDFRSTIFKIDKENKYRQCGLFLRESGSLDFVWNFRVVDTSKTDDYLLDGFVDSISIDFDFMYYRKFTI